MARIAGKQQRRNYARKTNMRKPKVSTTLKTAIKSVMTKQVETKTINVPDAAAGTTNTVGRVYPSGAGLLYLVQDVFKVKQGVNDSTVVYPFNRIGDKIKGVGFLMDYYIHTYNAYALGGNQYPIPWAKIRITVWKQAFGTPLITSPLLYDTNFLTGATSTLQPLNWDEGYIKDSIYDKTFIVKANYQPVDAATITPFPLNNVFHFKKYIKYDQFIKFADNNTISPNSTDKPIYITISAEVDEGNTFVPSGARLLNITGYTRAWFKDA